MSLAPLTPTTRRIRSSSTASVLRRDQRTGSRPPEKHHSRSVASVSATSRIWWYINEPTPGTDHSSAVFARRDSRRVGTWTSTSVDTLKWSHTSAQKRVAISASTASSSSSTTPRRTTRLAWNPRSACTSGSRSKIWARKPNSLISSRCKIPWRTILNILVRAIKVNWPKTNRDCASPSWCSESVEGTKTAKWSTYRSRSTSTRTDRSSRTCTSWRTSPRYTWFSPPSTFF